VVKGPITFTIKNKALYKFAIIPKKPKGRLFPRDAQQDVLSTERVSQALLIVLLVFDKGLKYLYLRETKV